MAQPDEWTIRRSRTFTLRLWGYEIHGVPLFEMLPQGHQQELLFCYCTRIKLRIETTETLLWQTWVWGGQEDLECLCECGVWAVKGPQSQLRVWLLEWLLDGQTGRFPQHLLSYQVCQSYSLHQGCSISSFFLKVYFTALAECILHHSKPVTFLKKPIFCYWNNFEKYLNY